MLVDTGIGPEEGEGLSGGKLLESLALAGHGPDDVTDRHRGPPRDVGLGRDGCAGGGRPPDAGHTPGSTVVVLSSGTQRALLLGDVIHCPVELLDDEWAGMADVDPIKALQVRNSLARALEGDDVVVASGTSRACSSDACGVASRNGNGVICGPSSCYQPEGRRRAPVGRGKSSPVQRALGRSSATTTSGVHSHLRPTAEDRTLTCSHAMRQR